MGELKIQKIYTDGACSGNPGPGGWGVVAYLDDRTRHELGGGEPQTTNNRMELQAAIAALQFLKDSGQTTPIELYTDSEYVKNGITKWINGWKNKGWKTAAGKAVLNQDLWEELDKLNSRQVQWRYVRGHAGDEGNERCDVIARAYSLGKRTDLTQQDFSLKNASAPSPLLSSANTNLEAEPIQSTLVTPEMSTSHSPPVDSSMADSVITDGQINLSAESAADVPREVKVAQLRDMVSTLQIADEVAQKRYLITSSEVADLMDINASAVTSRGDNWVWRNWVVSRVRREGNQILWQLERVD
jgi:ribonuclease HI